MELDELQFENEYRAYLLYQKLKTITPDMLAWIILHNPNAFVNAFIHPRATARSIYGNPDQAAKVLNTTIQIFGESCESEEEYFNRFRDAFIEEFEFLKTVTTTVVDGQVRTSVSWFSEHPAITNNSQGSPYDIC